MNEKLLWLLGFIAVYWAFCIYLGIRGARLARTASDYFLAGRSLPVWVFVLAATAISFSGWSFMGHPALIFQGGFPYAFLAFFTIMVPLGGVLFLKRQWMLGKRYGYVTPGEMFFDYYRCEKIRLLTVLVALLFTIPFMGVQLEAAGYLFSVLSDGLISQTAGILLLAMAVFLYVIFGGMRAVAYADSFQCILLALGVIAITIITVYSVGGISGFLDGLDEMARLSGGLWGQNSETNTYVEIPGLADNSETKWTSLMIMTFLIGMMGIQASPTFSMWSFGNADPKPFAPQQVWVSALALGGILIIFSTAQGIGIHMLGGNPNLSATTIPVDYAIPNDVMERPDTAIPYILRMVQDQMPWLVGFLGVCALAAMQSAGAAYLSTTGAMMTRDVFKRHVQPLSGHSIQKFIARLSVLLILLFALIIALYNRDPIVLLGGLAVGFAVQMLPALLGICWLKQITARGVGFGILIGLLAVFFTDTPGIWLMNTVGLDLWERWPLSIHSAGWGLGLNLIVCFALSAMGKSQEQSEHQDIYHAFLTKNAGLPDEKKKFVPIAFVAVATWIFFAIGPGNLIGNDLFGSPEAGREGWMFGLPSLWVWQVLFWLLGVAMLWFLAYKMELSTVPEEDIESLSDDINDPRLDEI